MPQNLSLYRYMYHDLKDIQSYFKISIGKLDGVIEKSHTFRKIDRRQYLQNVPAETITDTSDWYSNQRFLKYFNFFRKIK